jgi:hypothetical protein
VGGVGARHRTGRAAAAPRPLFTPNEIWVMFRDPVYNPKGKHMITLLETNVVTFVKSGLASKNVEYWNIIPGCTHRRRLGEIAARPRRAVTGP